MPAIGIIFTFLFENKSYAIMKVDIIITYVYMLMSCPCVFYCDPAESGGVIVLWSIVWDRYACIQSYMGFTIYNYNLESSQMGGKYENEFRTYKTDTCTCYCVYITIFFFKCSCLYCTSVTIKTLYYPTDAQIYNS